MVSENQRDLIGGSLKLILFAVIIYLLIDKVIMKQIELIYPYITYQMLDIIYTWLIISFISPGILLIILAYFGKYFDPKYEVQIPKFIQILFVITAILSMISIIGIRTGVSIILNLKGSKLDNENINEEKIKEESKKTYILYLISSGLYLLVFGLFFLALINFILVITYPLLYPTLNQPLMIGLEIWFWICLIVPSFLFLAMSFVVHLTNNNKKYFLKIKGIIKIGAVLAIFGIFGISNGINLIQSQWMLD